MIEVALFMYCRFYKKTRAMERFDRRGIFKIGYEDLYEAMLLFSEPILNSQGRD